MVDVLTLSATPIPRSLALTLYGDLDLSVLDEKPPGRPELTTRIVQQRSMRTAYTAVRACVERGEQAFVMYPLIEASEEVAARAVLAEEKTLRQTLKGVRVGILHGRMPEDEKLAVMELFRQRKIDVLAATPVIEVGIDIPNATTMLVMSAERFGLAQLHQMRGRIGRGSQPSTCLLCPDTATPATRKRLDLMVRSDDGFALAEADLELRGPGELFGTRQHGQVRFKYATVFDARTLAAAKAEAARLLGQDRTLGSWPLLRAAVGKVAEQLHLE
jgi:ATP-dependent DNA helicase RecG